MTRQIRRHDLDQSHIPPAAARILNSTKKLGAVSRFSIGRCRLLLPLAALALLCCPPITDLADPSLVSAACPEGRSSLDQISGPMIETTVTGFTLEGRTRFERRAIQDFDIVLGEDEVHSIPLLRILRVLKVDVSDSCGSISFRPDGGEQTLLDYVDGELTLGPYPRAVPLVVGLSDLTYEPEIYVQHDVVGEILGMDVSWDPQRYEYMFRTDKKLRIFDRESGSGSLLTMSGAGATIDLPGNLPPAQVGRSILPGIDFASIRMQGSVVSRQSREEPAGTLSPPRYGLWGHALGGNVGVMISQKKSSPEHGFKVEDASWGTYLGNVGLSYGSTGFGLSDLSFPSVTLLGLTFNGSFGGQVDARRPDRSQLGRRETYEPRQVIEGYAPLGSEVLLEVNGRAVDAQVVDETDGAPPGEGVYRFEGFNIFTSRLNELKIVVTEPDGTVTESARDVLGSDYLAGKGRFSFLGGAGGRRLAATDDFSSEGTFAGVRFSYGIADGLTIGGSGAYQDGLYERDSLRLTQGATADTIPSESIHGSLRCAWQPFDPLVLTGEAARSEITRGGVVDWAHRLGAELHAGGLRLYPAYFRYGPSFFDGKNTDIRDVEGSSIGAIWRFGSGHEISAGISRLQDNLNGKSEHTNRLSDGVAELTVRRLIPRSTLILGTSVVWVEGGPTLQQHFVRLDGSLPAGWSYRSQFSLRDNIRERLRESLPDGSPTTLNRILRQSVRSGVGSAMGSGANTSRVELRRRLGRNWQLSLAYRASDNLERALLDLSRGASTGGLWQWRVSPGYDWEAEAFFVQNRLELFIGGNRNNRVVLDTQLEGEDWFVRLSLQGELHMGFVDNLPVPMTGTRINPDVGGIKGRVFVDFNGNGLLDRGEPGLEDIDVSSDMGWNITTKNRGLFVIANTTYRRAARVSLNPETLPAVYTPIQATQDAVIRPGMFTEVNLGVGAFGSISGSVFAVAEGEEPEGVAGLYVLLVDSKGKVISNSITAGDGSYYLGEVSPGSHVIRIDETAMPENFTLDENDMPVEVYPDAEFFEIEGMNLTGRYTEPPEEVEEDEAPGTEFKVFD